MNKLISRNPIQRFKQGRKIVKAYDGVELNVPSLSFFPSKSPRISLGLNPDDIIKAVTEVRTPTASYLEPETAEAKKQREDYFNKKKRELGFNNMPEAPDYRKALENNYYSQQGKGRSYIENGNNYWIGSDGSKTFVSGKVIGKDGKEYWKGSDGSMTLLKSSKPITNSKKVTIDPKRAKIIEWQNKLKDFYEPGTFAADGMWGKNTEAAYQKYLLDQSNKKVIADLPNTLPVIKSFSPTPTINPNQTLNIQAPQQTFNRAQVRDFIRSKGFGAYDFTGDQRKALRMVLNGQGTDADKALVQSMGIFKKGGQLPSRNIVTRFKMRVKQ